MFEKQNNKDSQVVNNSGVILMLDTQKLSKIFDDINLYEADKYLLDELEKLNKEKLQIKSIFFNIASKLLNILFFTLIIGSVIYIFMLAKLEIKLDSFSQILFPTTAMLYYIGTKREVAYKNYRNLCNVNFNIKVYEETRRKLLEKIISEKLKEISM